MSSSIITVHASSRCIRKPIRHEGVRTLRALYACPHGATAEYLAQRLGISENALRSWMRRARVHRLVRIQRLPVVVGPEATPRLCYHIDTEGLKWIQSTPAQAMADNLSNIAERVPNSVFSLGSFLK